MKHVRIGFILFLFSPLIAFAGTGGVTPVDAIDTLTRLIDKYESRIAALEAENAAMRSQLEKAGILKATPTQTGNVSPTPSPQPAPEVPTTPAPTVQPTTTDSATQKGFIDRVRKDWEGIKSAYALPADAKLAGYEFVQSGGLDHVFVDIIKSGWTDGSLYDYKILYQFDLTTYQRKLVGYFELEPTLGKYATKKGANPFAGVPRIFVRDTLTTVATPPTPVNPVPTSTGSNSSTPPPTTVVTPPVTVAPTGSSSTADIETAYKEKRYLSVISLSNTYLATNPATVDILRMRYRTFFIIGKYNDSLTEIKKLQALQGGNLDRTIACDAQVIATYSKDQTLINTYTKICKG